VENCCGRVGRTLAFLLIGCAIACTIVTCVRCDFYEFTTIDGRPSSQLDPPFASATVVEIGVFKYRIVDSSDPGQEMDACREFANLFQEFDSGTGSGNNYWAAAQIIMVIAALAGSLAFCTNFVEVICCNFYCSHMVTSTLLFIAGILQGCSFLLFADHTFCLQQDVIGNHRCELAVASYASFVAVGGYLLAGTILGCLPRPDPCVGSVCCNIDWDKTTRDYGKKGDGQDNGDYGDDEEAYDYHSRGDMTPHGTPMKQEHDSDMTPVKSSRRGSYDSQTRMVDDYEYHPEIAPTMRESSDEEEEYFTTEDEADFASESSSESVSESESGSEGEWATEIESNRSASLTPTRSSPDAFTPSPSPAFVAPPLPPPVFTNRSPPPSPEIRRPMRTKSTATIDTTGSNVSAALVSRFISLSNRNLPRAEPRDECE